MTNMELTMTRNEFESLSLLVSNNTSSDEKEEFNIPLCMDDIINICREYNKLGWQIQFQVENLLQIGIEEAIKNGHLKKESLPQIRIFLKKIIQNPYFGDAADQAQDCLELIQNYEDKYKISYISKSN